MLFDDDHQHCFACGYMVQPHAKKGAKVNEAPQPNVKFVTGRYEDLSERGISKKICKQYGYHVADNNGKRIEIANYYDTDGTLINQKARSPNKAFRFATKLKHPPLFGGHLWKGGGKKLTITEGEIDALTMAEMFEGKWPVVSVPTGAKGAANAVRQNLEWINSFEQVIFCFDMDEEGRAAAKQCSEIVAPGKAAIMSLPRKDANEMWTSGERKALHSAFWEAKVQRPDGILHVAEVKDRPKQKQTVWPYPWRSMTKHLMGQRSGEIVMYTSGTGMGKSTLIREIAHHHLEMGNSVGMLMLEESCEETLDDLIGLRLAKPVRQIRVARDLNAALGEAIEFDVVDDLDDDEYERAKEELCETGLYLYDHFGENLADNIIAKLEYMITGLGCRTIVLDHISVVVAAMDSGNERQDIDYMMTQLRSLIERTGALLILVTQLRKSAGRAYEEGGRISLQELRGSGSLSSVPNSVIAVERNQQATDEGVRNTMIVRSLKGRFNGRTGIVAALQYDNTTGRLKEVDWTLDEKGEPMFGDKPMHGTESDGESEELEF